jgi:protein-tyrosine phosphatase
VDLRWPTEVEALRSPYTKGAVYRNVPVDTPMKMDLPKHAAAGTLTELLRVMREPQSGLCDAVEAIAKSDPAVVIHCSAGRDRTGFVVALILAALDVVDEDIVADHCMSDIELEPEYEKFRRDRPEEAERHVAIVEGRDRTVSALLRAIRSEYGHATAYLRVAGVSETALMRLRAMLV